MYAPTAAICRCAGVSGLFRAALAAAFAARWASFTVMTVIASVNSAGRHDGHAAGSDEQAQAERVEADHEHRGQQRGEEDLDEGEPVDRDAHFDRLLLAAGLVPRRRHAGAASAADCA